MNEDRPARDQGHHAESRPEREHKRRPDEIDDRQHLLILEERKRLARDLHDSVNQKLFSLSLIARGLSNKLSGEDESVRRGIQDIGKLAQEALIDLRNLIWQLRPVDTDQDFLDLLQEYGEKIGLNVAVECYGEEVELAERYVEAMLRIGQEALNNVRKHSRTDRASIRFEISRQRIMLRVADQGCGFDAALARNPYHSFGITSMQERASQLGGEVRVCSSPGSGTVVALVVPIASNLEGEEAQS